MSATSIRARLLHLSKESHIDFQNIATRYFHESLLRRLAKSPWANHFLLKGGNYIYAQYGIKSRPTTDVDLLGPQLNNEVEEVKAIFTEIFKIETNDFVNFDKKTLITQPINEQNQYQGIRLIVNASFHTIKQNIQIDIGFGDVITPAPQTLHYPILLEDFEVPVIQAYTIETVIAEKLQAIMVLAQLNSIMKDFYDIYSLLKSEKINLEVLKEAITQTFNNRNTPVNFDSIVFKEEFYTDANRLKMWKAFLTKIKADNISFETVIKTIQQIIKEIF